jgi:hypothetical protein
MNIIKSMDSISQVKLSSYVKETKVVEVLHLKELRSNMEHWQK